MTELARRAVACEGWWRWMPGTLPLVVDEDGDCVACDRVWRTQGGHTVVPAEALPDLTDDLTRLGLITLVQEAHPECRIDLCDDMARVIRSDGDGVNVTDGWLPTAEALVAALEAAP